ncbi:MAG: hypothetical protein HYZ14_05985 [Bacteroidetes bacterium]|nr:hypothetical protein [Bacteroidota bacterium]
MERSPFEINLHYLSMAELYAFKDDYPGYEDTVLKMFALKDEFVFEDEILKNHGKQTMQEVEEENDVRYVEVGEREREGKPVRVWIDTWADQIIMPGELAHGIFFTYKIRHLDLTDLDAFLDFHLEKYYADDFTKFSRFLTLTIRKHARRLLQGEHVLTIQEWIKQKQDEQSSEQQEKTVRLKGRPQRNGDDKITVLNQEQTVLLIHYLKKAKVFFQDDYLTNKQAGQAFHILTGYSADSLRQKLANHELNQINSKKNLVDLKNLFVNIMNLISNDLNEKK